MLAGFMATVVMSVFMVMKTVMGVIPGLDMAAVLAKTMGAPDTPIMGWIGHFTIGTVGLGIVFALLAGKLPRSLVIQGTIVGMLGWLAMLMMVTPMAGAGLLGLNFAIMAPMMTLMLHIIFGAVLGWVYAQSTARITERSRSGDGGGPRLWRRSASVFSNRRNLRREQKSDPSRHIFQR